ncbi:hypothetical protein GVN20_26800 [Runella sp. CRIBMP]|uniref:hypothetical protein n=1 Tax=Runella sp. CRIBMP TaxID=2683261 RepID=UPI0014124045|nr:hypothetical protein [Runella sp. CRIBMP]NBB22994.1 hypothetical protein [Runella sp. CRIBMP]
MIRWVLVFAGMVAVAAVNAQPTTIETMVGKQNYFYQHTISKSLGSSRFGFMHTSSLHAFYEGDDMNELMSQTYVTYSVMRFLKLGLGTFYASKPGISPAVSLQFRYAHRDFQAFLVPRVDLKKNGSVEMMILLEYTPAITERIHFYSRAQFMTNYGPKHHNRSFQNFRAGLHIRQTVVGIALNIDQRGKTISTLYNPGVFLRYELH